MPGLLDVRLHWVLDYAASGRCSFIWSMRRIRPIFPGRAKPRISSMKDVIIVGGGPVGFINALGLAQAGVRLSVIEAEPQIITSPRAAVYFWSVLEGLERLGILAERGPLACAAGDYMYLVRSTGERIVYLDGDTERTHAPPL